MLYGHADIHAQIDIALGCTNGNTGNGHAFNQNKRVAFHHHTVRESTGIAFIGIADDVFLFRGRIENRIPFNAGWESRAATTTQTGIGNCFDNICAVSVPGHSLSHDSHHGCK